MVGHFRTFEYLYPKLKNLDATFFMHTWSDHTTKSQNENRPFLPRYKDILLKFDKNVCIEKQSDLSLPNFNNVPASYSPIMHATKNVLKRVVEAGSFDRIIMTRYDIDLKNYNYFPKENEQVLLNRIELVKTPLLKINEDYLLKKKFSVILPSNSNS